MNNDFMSVKVGEKLWVRTGDYEGWGEVHCIQTTLLKPIHMKLNNGYYLNCNYNGKAYNDGPQVLFWDRVEIIPPPRPKRMKKVVKVTWGESNYLIYPCCINDLNFDWHILKNKGPMTMTLEWEE